ncbi:MAG: XRE family transcriptional regulator [Bdellovibrionota bacterium]
MAILKDKAGQNIAKNLAALRDRKGLSQVSLAKISGTTRASIALLESGSANPTLDILLKISQGLRISIDELISSPRAECKHIKASDVPLDRKSRNGIILRKLLPDKIPSTEMDELHLEPGATMTGSPHVEGTREYFTCISGQISIGVLGEIHHLEKGDVLTFPGDKPHSYKNSGKGNAVGISVVFFSTTE